MHDHMFLHGWDFIGLLQGHGRRSHALHDRCGATYSIAGVGAVYVTLESDALCSSTRVGSGWVTRGFGSNVLDHWNRC